MPQMAPMLWLILMIMFLIIFFLFLLKNFFNVTFLNKNINKFNKFEKHSFNWKW
uniref:ATP synthase F0 subunit 8 n=1 Tax=Pulex irritans TaxID=173820 RepID=UPI002027F2F6|nr:ATP synthase F0 subunit 8 [Pulex irritans]UPV72698.1 ATP synthase F0 subunit 8 [Pulex irritans]